MKQLFRLVILLLIPCSLLAGPDQVSLKIGVLAYRPKPQVMAQWQPVAAYEVGGLM